MEYECPVCNGLTEINKECPECGELMDDSGMIEDFYGPYSPYENVDLYDQPGNWDKDEVEPCVHLYSCPGCGYDTRIVISRVVI